MARNLGIDHAQGTYIGFVDSDDLIVPEMFETMVSKMKDEIQFVCCRFCKCMRENIMPLGKNEKFSIHSGEGIPYQIVCNYYCAYVWSKLFRKDLLDRYTIRFKSGYIMEDMYFMADYLRICQKACFLEDQLYYYIDTNGSILNNFRSRRNVEPRYVHIPRSWVYFAQAVTVYPQVCAEATMRAAMSYQSVLRKLTPEDDAFTAEAIAYVRKNNHLLLLHRWGIPYFVSGCILCLNYRLWKAIFRR